MPYKLDVIGEGPYAPQQLVGIPQGHPTGPQPIFYVLGLGDVHAAVWSLQTAGGVVVPGVKMVDSAAAAAAGHPGYFSERGWMVPPVLQPNTAYTGSVTWDGTLGQLTQAFSFTARMAPNVIGLYYRANVLHAESEAPGGYVEMTRRGHMRRVPIPRRLSTYEATVRFARLPSGVWRFCAVRGGDDSGYEAGMKCLTVRVRRRQAVH